MFRRSGSKFQVFQALGRRVVKTSEGVASGLYDEVFVCCSGSGSFPVSGSGGLRAMTGSRLPEFIMTAAEKQVLGRRVVISFVNKTVVTKCNSVSGFRDVDVE